MAAPPDPPAPAGLRRAVRAGDPDAVRRLARSTRFFIEEEVEVAAELVEDTLSGRDPDYRFVMADDPDAPGELLGYACFGPIPATQESWHLYWIAVRPDLQGRGLGGRLLAAAEEAAWREGGRRMYLDTSGTDDYAPTRGFYLRWGYAVVANLPDYYAPGDAKVEFFKLLAGP